MTLRQLLREPLVHFVTAGAVLFAVFSPGGGASADAAPGRAIRVDEPALLTFLQYRSKAFEPEYFSAQLRAMGPEERQALEDQYVEEEMLYREAKALGLEQGDYVIRQRLVQKMRFLIDDLVERDGQPSDATLDEYLQKNRDLYVIDPSVTFTHVFVDVSEHGEQAAQELARRLQAELAARGAVFTDAPQFGERFPFLQNYVERTFDYVASHFGADFASQLKTVAPSAARWSGPIRSDYGSHVVLVTHRTEARLPALDEIRTQVEEDWRQDRLEGTRSESLIQLAGQYTIDRTP